MAFGSLAVAAIKYRLSGDEKKYWLGGGVGVVVSYTAWKIISKTLHILELKLKRLEKQEERKNNIDKLKNLCSASEVQLLV